jgi:hypothetical protein
MSEASVDAAIPGSDLIGAGIADLAAGRTTVEALLVLLARDRLLGLGFDISALDIEHPEARMYELIEQDVGARRAHGRYNALRRRMLSFIRSMTGASSTR